MLEINGKFAKWLKSCGISAEKIGVSFTHEIDSLDGMSCNDIVVYMQKLIEVHGEDAVYNEHWFGYEDFTPEVVTYREETDEEHKERILELRRKYDAKVHEERKAVEEQKKKIELKIKELQDQMKGLK